MNYKMLSKDDALNELKLLKDDYKYCYYVYNNYTDIATVYVSNLEMGDMFRELDLFNEYFSDIHIVDEITDIYDDYIDFIQIPSDELYESSIKRNDLDVNLIYNHGGGHIFNGYTNIYDLIEDFKYIGIDGQYDKYNLFDSKNYNGREYLDNLIEIVDTYDFMNDKSKISNENHYKELIIDNIYESECDRLDYNKTFTYYVNGEPYDYNKTNLDARSILSDYYFDAKDRLDMYEIISDVKLTIDDYKNKVKSNNYKLDNEMVM